MRYRVHLTKDFRSVEDALKWLRADVAHYKSLPRTPTGCLEDRPRWEVIEGGKTTLTVDEWGCEEVA